MFNISTLQPNRLHRVWTDIIDTSHTRPLSVPVLALRSNHDNPHPIVGITSSVHGDELNGIFAIHKLFESVGYLHRGTIIGVPIVNVEAFTMAKRSVRGRDLNRNFPPRDMYWHSPLSFEQAGLLGQQHHVSLFARSFYDKIASQLDYVADLHTCSTLRESTLHLRADMRHSESAEMATRIAHRHVPFILHLPPVFGSLRYAVAHNPVPRNDTEQSTRRSNNSYEESLWPHRASLPSGPKDTGDDLGVGEPSNFPLASQRPGVTFEIGNPNVLQHDLVDHASCGLKQLLGSLGMLSPAIPHTPIAVHARHPWYEVSPRHPHGVPKAGHAHSSASALARPIYPNTFFTKANKMAPVVLRSPRWIHAPQAGVFHSHVRPGQLVHSGDCLATICDVFGTVKGRIIVPPARPSQRMSGWCSTHPPDPLASLLRRYHCSGVIAGREALVRLESEVTPQSTGGGSEKACGTLEAVVTCVSAPVCVRGDPLFLLAAPIDFEQEDL